MRSVNNDSLCPTLEFSYYFFSSLLIWLGPTISATGFFVHTITIFKKQKSWHPVPSFYANRWGNNGNMTDFIFLGSKITSDGE